VVEVVLDLGIDLQATEEVMSELVMVALGCLRQGLDAAYRPLDEQCGHDLCARIRLERFLGNLRMDIAGYGRLYDVENLVALGVKEIGAAT
jgi:hypothetical protein